MTLLSFAAKRCVQVLATSLILFMVFAISGCGAGQSDSAGRAQAEQELARLREANQELQRLRAENQELPRLRKDNEELRRLREQSQELPQLREENNKLRGQLQALKAPKGPTLLQR